MLWMLAGVAAVALWLILLATLAFATGNPGIAAARPTAELAPQSPAIVDLITGVDMETGRALYDINKWSFTFVEDRPGHDLRYAIDMTKIETALGWRAKESLESGLRKTVDWYLANQAWCDGVQSGVYQGERLGLRMAQ